MKITTEQLKEMVQKEVTNLLKEAKSPTQAANDYLSSNGFKERVNDKQLTEKYNVVGKGKIDPKSLGNFAPVFTEITYEIKFGGNLEKNFFAMNFNYQYKHPSGSNGVRIDVRYKDGKLNVQS